MYVSLIQNAALLVALSTLYGLLARLRRPNGRWNQILSGVLFGAVAVVGMLLPFRYEPGIIYDGRSIILAAGGLFSGGLGTVVSIVIAGAYRAYLGGAGVWAGLATIVFCSAVGYGFRVLCRRPPEQKSILSLYLLGLAAHVVMLACQLLLPWPGALTVISRVWLPVMLIFPVATALIGFLLRTEERRIQAARLLVEANERFNRLANELRAAVWTTSADGTTMRDLNSAVETISGIPTQTIMADPSAWWDAVHPDDQTAAREAASGLADRGRSHTEYRIVRPDGQVRWVRDSRSVIYDDRGTTTGLGGIITDITEAKTVALEREALRTQMLQSQKMEAIGRLAGGIAHDFNNLLTVINNYAALVIADARIGDAIRDDIEQIVVAGRRAAQLTRQLLTFSRQQSMEPQTIDLNQVVGEVDTMLSRLIGEDIALQTCLAKDVWPVKADPTQVHQVLMNLVVNARDAMNGGGTLTITTDNAHIEDANEGPREVPPGDWVTMAVCDTGHGMDQETQERIFEPFFTTKDMGAGTGLGLATVYGIVTQSGGHIVVHSYPGLGTTFTVFLPRAQEKGSGPGIQE